MIDSFMGYPIDRKKKHEAFWIVGILPALVLGVLILIADYFNIDQLLFFTPIAIVGGSGCVIYLYLEDKKGKKENSK